MPWSIFTQGGGDGAAATWAQDQLQLDTQEWGVNVDTPGNEQFVYDWEKSEGGGGAFNPLNQGPVPGHPELTTTGSQYGGGAADFASLGAGLQGALDYLDMPSYAGVKQALENNDPAGAETALIASPWAASHYGNGANFSHSPLPGHTNTINTAGGAQLTSLNPNPFDFFGIPGTVAGSAAGSVGSAAVKAGSYLLLVGTGVALIVAGVWKIANPGLSVRQQAGQIVDRAAQAGQAAAVAA